MKQRSDVRSEMYVLRKVHANDGATPTVTALDDLAHLTMRALDVPVALIVIDGGSNHRTSRKIGTAVERTCLSADREPHEIAQLANPVTAEGQGFAFYVATPLRDPRGHRLGTLAVLDERSRAVSEEDLSMLRKMAGIIEHMM